jgi:hypothetical protein
MVTFQAVESIRLRLDESGLRVGRDLVLKHRQKPYVNDELFANYIRAVLLSHLAGLRGNEELSDEEAPLLMDNCSPHLAPTAVQLLTHARVRIITFAPHTTHIFQVLDLALFGALKRRSQYQLSFDDEKRRARFIERPYHDFRLTMIDMNIWRGFQEIELTFVMTDAVQRVVLNDMKMRESRGFKELRASGFSPADVSARLRRPRFELVNKTQ